MQRLAHFLHCDTLRNTDIESTVDYTERDDNLRHHSCTCRSDGHDSRKGKDTSDHGAVTNAIPMIVIMTVKKLMVLTMRKREIS